MGVCDLDCNAVGVFARPELGPEHDASGLLSCPEAILTPTECIDAELVKARARWFAAVMDEAHGEEARWMGEINDLLQRRLSVTRKGNDVDQNPR